MREDCSNSTLLSSPEQPFSNSAERSLPKKWFQVSVQGRFQFMYEQLPICLLCLQNQQENSFEEFNTHCGAQEAVGRSEVRGTHLKAKLEARLQLLWQFLNQAGCLQREGCIEQDMESWMSHMKREQSINNLIKPKDERKCSGLGRENGTIHVLEFLDVDRK